MHRNGPDGRVTSGAPNGSNGDVDPHGEIVDERRGRLAAAIGVTAGEVDAGSHLGAILEELTRAAARAANVRGEHAAGLRP